MLSKLFFTGDIYETPADTKVSLLSKLFFYSRWVFYLKFFRQVLKSRKMAMEGNYDDNAWYLSSCNIFKIVENCGGSYSIKGLTNISKSSKPVVFIGNHMSTLETMVLPCMVAPHKKTTFVVKENLIHDPFFSAIMRSRKPIALGRQEPRKDMIKLLEEGKQRIDEGYSIIIFPEGTRQSNFDDKKLNSLGVKLAQKAGVSVVPIALKTDFWATTTFGKIQRKNKVFFSFGEPLDPSKDPKGVHKEVLSFMTTEIKKFNSY